MQQSQVPDEGSSMFTRMKFPFRGCKLKPTFSSQFPFPSYILSRKRSFFSFPFLHLCWLAMVANHLQLYWLPEPCWPSFLCLWQEKVSRFQLTQARVSKALLKQQKPFSQMKSSATTQSIKTIDWSGNGHGDAPPTRFGATSDPVESQTITVGPPAFPDLPSSALSLRCSGIGPSKLLHLGKVRNPSSPAQNGSILWWGTKQFPGSRDGTTHSWMDDCCQSQDSAKPVQYRVRSRLSEAHLPRFRQNQMQTPQGVWSCLHYLVSWDILSFTTTRTGKYSHFCIG